MYRTEPKVVTKIMRPKSKFITDIDLKVGDLFHIEFTITRALSTKDIKVVAVNERNNQRKTLTKAYWDVYEPHNNLLRLELPQPEPEPEQEEPPVSDFADYRGIR